MINFIANSLKEVKSNKIPELNTDIQSTQRAYKDSYHSREGNLTVQLNVFEKNTTRYICFKNILSIWYARVLFKFKRNTLSDASTLKSFLDCIS